MSLQKQFSLYKLWIELGSFGKCVEYVRSLVDDSEQVSVLRNNVRKFDEAFSDLSNLETNRKKIFKLLLREQPEQRSQAWYDLRKNMLTASSDISIITKDSYDHFAKKDHEFLYNQLILKKTGHVLVPFDGNVHTRRGVKYEPIAIATYTQKTKSKVWEFGLLQHQQLKFIGASPDGITPDGLMIEIKCPLKIKETVPKHYWVQIQIQLEVCDLDYCDFIQCKFEKLNREDCGHDFSGTIGIIRPVCKHKNDDCSCDSNEELHSHIYPQFSNSIPDQEYEITQLFKLNFSATHKFVSYEYYGLEQYSNIKVQRDRKWFASVSDDIGKAWKTIEYYRQNPQELHELYIKTKKQVKPQSQLWNPDYAVMDKLVLDFDIFDD